MAVTRGASASGYEPLRGAARARALARVGARRSVISAEIVIAGLVLIALVSLAVARPFVTGAGEDGEPPSDERRAALEAEKEAKYREIRDAELDFRMGKMSQADYRRTDRELRAQAIAILRRLDALDREGVGER